MVIIYTDSEIASVTAELKNYYDSLDPLSEDAKRFMGVSINERALAILRSRKMYEMDRQSNLLTLVRMGRTEGNTHLIEFAILNAFKDGMLIADIADNTGFTREEIENICNQS